MPNDDSTTEIDPLIVGRLAAVGIATEVELKPWRKWWRYNRDGFWWALERRETAEAKSAAAYEDWLPRLRRFASNCRAAAPISAAPASTPDGAEQFRILSEHMRAFRDTAGASLLARPGPNRATIVYTSTAGLPAAAAVFGDTDAFILSREEFDGFASSGADGGGPWDGGWWCNRWWWELPANDDPVAHRLACEATTPPAGSTVWVLGVGQTTGPLAGGGHYDRWLWDGTRATYWDRPTRWRT